MSTGPGLDFDAWIAAPPGPALIAVLLVLGVISIGCRAARLADTGPRRALAVAGGSLFATALLASVVHGLALAGLATPIVLRIVGAGVIAAVAGLFAPLPRSVAADAWRALAAMWRDGTTLDRAALAGSAIVIGGLALAALAPPTEIDTLAYHLSAPLHWLAQSGAYPTPHWLHARLLGVGESLNLLGLAMGTDCLSAVFQFSGIVVAAVALMSVARSARDRVLALVLVAACPLLSSLTLTAKPQLLPSAATAFAVAAIVYNRRTAFAQATPATIWMILAAVSFAIGSKYSFMPVGAAVVALLFWSLWRTPLRGTALAAAPVTFAAIALPVYVRNFLYYGDPLSPALESFTTDADPVVAVFSWYLRNFGGSHSLSELVRLPWNLVVPDGPGSLTTVLGVGALAGGAIAVRHREAWPVLVAAAVVTGVTALAGQLSGRFFLEPYWWCGIVAVSSPWTLRKRVLSALLTAQLILAAALAAYGAYALFPGALSAAGRERTLSRFAADYALAQWLDDVLPADAVIATDRRSMLFARRRTLPSDFCEMTALTRLSEPEKIARLRQLFEDEGAHFVLVTSAPRWSCYAELATTLGAPVVESPPFTDPARNPWRIGPDTTVALYDVRAPAQPAAAQPAAP